MLQAIRPVPDENVGKLTKTDTLRSADEAPWLNRRVPNGFWDCQANRIRYLVWLGNRCGFSAAADWYAVRKHHFQRNGGGGLLRNEYRSSVQNAMADFLPDYDWKPWLFGGAPNGYWKDRTHRALYLDWLGQQLGIQKTADWYDVTAADFFNHHGGGLLNNEFKGASSQFSLTIFRATAGGRGCSTACLRVSGSTSGIGRNTSSGSANALGIANPATGFN